MWQLGRALEVCRAALDVFEMNVRHRVQTAVRMATAASHFVENGERREYLLNLKEEMFRQGIFSVANGGDAHFSGWF